MLLRDARSVARAWVEEQASSMPGFHSAFFSGSMTALPDDAVLPEASDIDVKVVLDGTDDLGEPEKYLYHDVVLDVSCAAREELRTPEAVLGSYFTAVHFTYPCIISDPSGELTAMQGVVAREYARRAWVQKRCAHARENLLGSLAWLNPSGAIHNQATAWLFPIFFTTPIVLVADLRNPTHRRGMALHGKVLFSYGYPELQDRLLGIVGSESMSREQVETLLAGCAEAFDAAQAIRATPFLLGSNISDFMRGVAIGGAWELIADGYHREAMPWIAFIHTLCQTVFENDASDDVREHFTTSYMQLLGALGVPSYDALAERREQLGQLLPDLWQAAAAIIDTNPAIRV